jgi:hypothetical protein
MANAATSTYSGRSLLWARMRGLGTEGKNIGWGTGSQTGSANANVNLFAPATESRTAGTSTMVSTTFLADTYQVIGTIVCAGAGKTITEMGLFDTTTLSPTTTISNSLTTASSSITIGSSTGLPGSGNYYMQMLNETVLVTGGQGTTTLSVARGQLGSTATVAASGSPITLGGDGGANANAGVGGQTATVAASAGGNMFAHADFGGIALAVNDSISATWTDCLT